MTTSLFSNLTHKIADINLAVKGREEISWLEKEMPGLMAIRKKYMDQQPLKGMRISGSLHITTHTAVFIETLSLLGAQVRWCSSNIYSTQDHIAAAIAEKGVAIFAWKGESIEDYWWAIFKSFQFDDNKGPTHIIDERGDLALMIHTGCMSEKKPSILDEHHEVESKLKMNLFLKRILAENQNYWEHMSRDLQAISEISKTGCNELHQYAQEHKLIAPIFDVNTSRIKSKIDNFYSSKETIAEAIKAVTRTILIGKSVVICGFGEVGQGCAEALKINGARVAITETNPILALQAAMQGYRVVELEEVCSQADIFITATGQKHIIGLEHMKKMKDQAIICSMGHDELEVELNKLQQNKDIKKIPISLDLTRYYFPNGNSILIVAEAKLVNLAYDTSQLAFIKSCTYTLLTLLQLSFKDNNRQLLPDFYRIDPNLDQEVAYLHLNKLEAKVTKHNKTIL